MAAASMHSGATAVSSCGEETATRECWKRGNAQELKWGKELRSMAYQLAMLENLSKPKVEPNADIGAYGWNELK